METLAYLQLAQNYEDFESSSSNFEVKDIKLSGKAAASVVGITGAVLVGGILAADPASATGSSSVSSNCCIPVVVRPVSSVCCQPVVSRPIVVRPVVVRPIVVRPVVVKPVVSSSICCRPISRPIHPPSNCHPSCSGPQSDSAVSSDSDYYSQDYSDYYSQDYSDHYSQGYSNHYGNDYSNYYSYSYGQDYSQNPCNCSAESSGHAGVGQVSYYPTNDANHLGPMGEVVVLPQQAHFNAGIAPSARSDFAKSVRSIR
ncbi:hypothetical protein [Leptolyngbya sp. 7M]|uniref:hypothetical protein n=1 Tax=Leptolyngbya sp. 7M TaxID=2812896 RepID=UPI001B8AC465|nr:hypothetical protein [Leptolyngbya sp. 7M]QYO68176.1 hypothetical protein JVX88_16250 [Leptolyngbya sp. 7M]